MVPMLVRLLSGPLALCVLAATFLATSAGLPSVASAQDDGGFVFDDEEVEEFGEPMDFGEDDVDFNTSGMVNKMRALISDMAFNQDMRMPPAPASELLSSEEESTPGRGSGKRGKS